MDLGLRGRTATVCGASSGLGLASAEALAEEGANVTMFARRREQLERDADRIGALAVRGDVTNVADLDRLVAKTLEAFGGIDILVWNSGGPPAGKAGDVTDDELEAAFELLLAPAVRLVRLCRPYLERSGAHRRDQLADREGADCTSRAVERDPPRPHRLAEDALARGRAERRDRELRRARSDRHPTDGGDLRRERPAGRRDDADPDRPPRHTA